MNFFIPETGERMGHTGSSTPGKKEEIYVTYPLPDRMNRKFF